MTIEGQTGESVPLRANVAAVDAGASYTQYDEWKGWGSDGFMTLHSPLRAYYDREFAGMPVGGRKVLEVGFGHGSLLAWLKEQGAEVYGTELSDHGREAARERGVSILSADLEEADAMAGQFGMVVAFDVLEHLSHSDIRHLFDKVSKLLADGGFFVARFPNGGSPFSRSLQHGDVTHVSTLTMSKMNQLLLGIPLHVHRAGEPRSYFYGGIARRATKLSRNIVRTGFEKMIRMLYGISEPLSPNFVLVLRK